MMRRRGQGRSSRTCLEAAPVFYSSMEGIIFEKFPVRGSKPQLQSILKKGRHHC